MRTFKVKKTVEVEVSAEEVIEALRKAFDRTADETCPFRRGDIVDTTNALTERGQPLKDSYGEPVSIAYVVEDYPDDQTVLLSYIDSAGKEREEQEWVKWSTVTLLDRKW